MGISFKSTSIAIAPPPGVCSWYWDVEADDLYWSPELCELHGISDPPVNVADYLALIHPEDRGRVAFERKSFIEAGDTFDHEFRILRPDGQVRVLVDRGRTLRDADGRALRIEGVNIDVTDLRDAGSNVHSAERRAAFAARTGGLVSWEIEAESGYIYAEEGLPALFGLEGSAPTHMSGYLVQIHDEDRPGVLAEFEKAKISGGRYRSEFRVRTADGWRWLRGCGEGTSVEGVIRVVGFNVDIDDERRKRDALDLVAGEMAHRVKNTLAIVQALARQTFKNSEAAEVANFEGRLAALARSQDLVADGGAPGALLADVADTVIVRPLNAPERVRIEGPDVRLTAEMSLGVALVLHELFTNALKYGALASEDGKIVLSWSFDERGEMLLLDWREIGGPPVTVPTRSGAGSRLIRRVMTGSTGGSAEVKYLPDGLCCEMSMPASRLLAR
jgi:PAS domain S-box-containing protein